MLNETNYEKDVHQNGFTLIETIVVLIIAVMMIGVGATTYSNYSENLKAKKTAEEIKTIGYAYKTYLSSNRLDIINSCLSVLKDGNKQVLDNNLEISGLNVDSCRLHMKNLQTGLANYVPAGVRIPEKNPYKQTYFGYGQVKINRNDTAKSVITPLIVANPSNKTSQSKLEYLTGAKIAQLADPSTGFTYEKNGNVEIGGNVLFNFDKINQMAQNNLSAGAIFYTGGSLGVESELGYLDQQTADRRYLLRDEVQGHPEYNQMNTDLEMQENMVITQGGVAIQPTNRVKEGNECSVKDGDEEYLIKRSVDGYLVQCKNFTGRTMLQETGLSFVTLSNPGDNKTFKFYYWQDSGGNIFDIPQYENVNFQTGKKLLWSYVAPQSVPDSMIYVLSKDRKYFQKDTGNKQRLGIHVPAWYPYGNITVCPIIFKKDDTQFVYPDFPAGQPSAALLYNIFQNPESSSVIYKTEPNTTCFQMGPGESRGIYGYVHSVAIRFKGNIVPAFFRKFEMNGECGGTGDMTGPQE
ncbi:TPA: prepilin-type N-terminal cleavage/methylation domain-containing protein [Salmonella enterica]|uniref:Prepilin-type N-terminal cleavage/methylation domain-containing protein n=1 Tax=Salmonella enterica TaxID=28901 RepID=A0A759LK88_SALER|nr:prepilin-type N-terminal cleavage/methylation domain-containing protein [Salmonella enterica]